MLITFYELRPSLIMNKALYLAFRDVVVVKAANKLVMFDDDARDMVDGRYVSALVQR